jgi:hypothetical protein
MAKASKKTPEAAAANRFPYQYAAKFICMADIPGTSQQSAGLLPGLYQTAVNLHTPGKTTARIRMKLATGGVISPWKGAGLKYDEVLQVNCGQVQDFGVTFIHGFEGFLVIESSVSLDVVAVYTAGAVRGPVTSMDVEAVRERKI